MYFSKIIISIGLLLSVVNAAPSFIQRRSAMPAPRIIDLGISDLDAGDLEKREIIDLGITDDTSNDFEKRSSNYVSSCGSNWMPIADHDHKLGYRSAVKEFCYHVTHSSDGLNTVIGPHQKHAIIIQGGYYLKGDIPAAVNFEIHNKQRDGNHTPNQSDCETYLMKMADPNASCFGRINKDTKGGTWQINGGAVSYHALPDASSA
ncbi:hypothetical protein POX_d06122 [Penicillium oxalicum]|uniref:hypothetical protein n=1 Tax=Penicillium oxalicum TaxID=69781 RepID=UPI0020B79E39|nr:hypothetical protein POX_d06122 [Penicillium oxalicum]KAI2790601.1 hypothetical protein POX_d06122 [Penicillium oxalicum]